jgi:uncharacterized protein HemY
VPCFFGIEQRRLRLKAQGDSERRFVRFIAFAEQANRMNQTDQMNQILPPTAKWSSARLALFIPGA